MRILCFQISLGLDNLLPSAPVGEVAPQYIREHHGRLYHCGHHGHCWNRGSHEHHGTIFIAGTVVIPAPMEIMGTNGTIVIVGTLGVVIVVVPWSHWVFLSSWASGEPS